MISVIIPAYNERDSIEEIISRVKEIGISKEIIIVDDGSTDGTRQVLEGMHDPEIKVLFHEKNYGKGHAIRTAIKAVTKDIVIIQDADLEYSPRDYPALIKPIVSNKAEVVYGSRWLKKGLNKVPFNLFRFGRWLLTSLTNLLYGINITDEPCCYKVFKKEVIKSIPLECERFEFCPEITAKLARRGYKIYEVPVSYDPRGIEDGKKITYRDGLEAVATLLKYRFWK
ncbi:MAG: glycosyltransferase family 2 protein [Candidatus Omnitrophica bacterium]|nr:glycosyltransferase family 2 protein [Candidatus Omnitrophota bacterium]